MSVAAYRVHMGDRLIDSSMLLSESQLESFRALVTARREAAFLAPQLLEQVMVLTGQLRTALRSLDRIRGAAGELAAAYDAGLSDGSACPTCQDVSLRAALRRLYMALGEDPAIPCGDPSHR